MYSDLLEHLVSHNHSAVTLKDHQQRTVLSLLAEQSIKAVHELVRTKLGLAPTALDAWRRVDPAAFIRHLLDRPDIQPNATDALGRTALSYASQCGFGAAVEALLAHNGIIIDIADHIRQMTPLQYASEQGHKDTVQLLHSRLAWNDSRDILGHTTLSQALKTREGAVGALLKENAFELGGDWGSAALHNALASGRKEEALSLIANGADVDAVNEDGRTPLHIATRSGYEEVVLTLLKHGANIEAHTPYSSRYNDDNSETALSIASHAGHEEIVCALLERGAAVNPKYSSPLCAATHQGHESIVKVLLVQGAEVNRVGRMWEYEDEIESVLGFYHKTPLWIAANKGHYSIVQLLLAHGVDIDGKNQVNGETALHTAAVHGHKSIVRLLLDGGADINAADSINQLQPLHHAAERGHEDVVKLLLDRGADINATDLSQWQPLDRAAWNGERAVAQLLMAHIQAANSSH